MHSPVAAYEVPKGCLIFGGKPWPCAVPTKLWVHHGLEFKVSDPGSRPRGAPPRALVTHYTAGEETPQGLYDVLRMRKLGVEFSIYADGTLWQHCDPVFVDTFDAGFFNRPSAGVEIVNRGLAPAFPRVPREAYDAKINGKPVKFLKFTDAQMLSYVALCNTLCAALDIPRVVPWQRRVMSGQELASFSGVLGHFHLTTDKLDPGTQPFEVLLSNDFSELRK